MKIQFVYDPKMEIRPLQVGFGGANDSQQTNFAERAVKSGVDIQDVKAVREFALSIITEDGIKMDQARRSIDEAWRSIEPKVGAKV